jgi:hypothetical protein
MNTFKNKRHTKRKKKLLFKQELSYGGAQILLGLFLLLHRAFR